MQAHPGDVGCLSSSNANEQTPYSSRRPAQMFGFSFLFLALPPLAMVLSHIIIALGVASNSNFSRRCAFVLQVSFTAFLITCKPILIGAVGLDYTFGSALATVSFIASDSLILSAPPKHCGLSPDAPPHKRSMSVTREQQVKHSSSNRTTTPSSFIPLQCIIILSEISYLFALYSLVDMFSGEGIRLSKQTWPRRSMYTLLLGGSTYSYIDVVHRAWQTALVVTGVLHSSEFRPLFGSLSHACTLRGFWGRTWHQMLRKVFIPHCKYISLRVLGLPQGHTTTRLAEVYVAFLISGIIHAAGELMVYTPHHPVYGTGSFIFFLLQAPAIHLEAWIMSLAAQWFGCVRNEKANKYCRMLGFVWVWQWFVLSAPVMFDPMVDIGMGRDIQNLLRRFR